MKKKLIDILILILLIILIYSGYHIINYLIDEKNTKNQLEKITEETKIKEIDDDKNIEIIEPSTKLSKDDPYWDYIRMNLIDVDISNLKKKNSDIEGWIQINGTNINYPFVQTSNNTYYLNHSINKEKNKAGWIFMDYRNNLNSKNTIIYAHSRLDGTMFGTLKKTLNEDWLNNKNNHIIKISTEKENTLWQVFSVYHIKTTSDYLKINFSNDEEFISFTNKIINRSIYNFNTKISKTDKILTLSTCYKKTERLVIHAKLIKKETK